MQNIIMTGTGSYIPDNVIGNDHFLNHEFYDENNERYTTSNEEIISKFKDITGIEQRRYADKEHNNSDLGFFAAERAIKDAGIDQETLDYIIVGQNAGEVLYGTNQSDMIPSIASRIKYKLKIKNKRTIAYDLMFGCPGWLQGVIHMEAFMRAGIAKKALVIGAETLSRVVDVHDRDSMIFADGAGATLFEVREEETKRGILACAAVSDTYVEAEYLYMDKTFNKEKDDINRYIKMKGRKIYEYALSNVPAAMKEALDKSGIEIGEVKKIFIHQANEKMDAAIIKRFYRQYGIRDYDENIVPMSIDMLGNSSVATVPTLIDLVRTKRCRRGHEINEGDVAIFASVGAGMNINAVVYKF